MTSLRSLRACIKLKGVGFVYVGSFGTEPNWFARTMPSRVSDKCRREFVTAFAAVRKEFDLMPPDANGSVQHANGLCRSSVIPPFGQARPTAQAFQSHQRKSPDSAGLV
jgi:hypothetical protein